MSIKRLTLFLWGFILITSCKSNTGVTDTNNTWQLTFEKGGCMDVCQAYTITIKATGNYAYKGNFKVKHLGLKTGVLKKEDLHHIDRLINTIDWDNEKLTSSNNANGSQLKVFNYSNNTITKKVTYYLANLQEIKDLEHYIDTIIDHDEF